MNYRLNLNGTQAQLVSGLRTEQVGQLILLVTGDQLSSYEIRSRGKTGLFSISSRLGQLLIKQSDQPSQNRRRLWDIDYVPTQISL